jgi:LAS superfamily LD-carboxypeptidase LdcB
VRWLAALVAVALSGSATPARAEDLELEAFDAVGYKNGRRFPLQVVAIEWTYLEVHTAKAYLAMKAAAAADGIDLWIRSGFRTYEEQEWFYQAWKEGWGNKAAKPGKSNHQTGIALDINLDLPGSYDWLEKHAKKFGFKRTVRGEPWHWEYTKKHKKKKAKKGKKRPG